MNQQIVPAWGGISLYQFKITLLDTRPPIWRRIQVMDGILDKLHEHIQTAMGWTNSHLYHFWIDSQHYGDDPMLHEMKYKDSTRTKLSDILPKSDRRTTRTTDCLQRGCAGDGGLPVDLLAAPAGAGC